MMFLKRFILLCIVLVSLPALSAGIKVQTRYVQYSPGPGAAPVALVDKVLISCKEMVVTFEKADSLFRQWKVTGPNYDGTVTLFLSKSRGIGWLFKLGEDSLKAVIARDYRNSASPGLISITTNFVAGLYLLQNRDADCNGHFAVYSLKNTWDADVEYTGAYALEMQSSDPCGDGQWKISMGKLKMIRKIQFAAIFTGIMSQNIRHLFKDYVLEEEESN